MGGTPTMPDPYSASAVAFREKEMKQQLAMAHEEQKYQRTMAEEEREWQEDLENRRATRKQKEEQERIRKLQGEQRLSGDEASGMIAEGEADVDQRLSNLWSSLATGVGSTTGAGGTTTASAGSGKKGVGASFSSWLTGSLGTNR